MNSIRVNYNKCAEQSFIAFINNINDNNGFIFKAHNPADQSVTQDRYTYNKGKLRVSIVYETKAQTLIITAPQNVIRDIEALLPADIEKSGVKELRPQNAGTEGQKVDAKKAVVALEAVSAKPNKPLGEKKPQQQSKSQKTPINKENTQKVQPQKAAQNDNTQKSAKKDNTQKTQPQKTPQKENTQKAQSQKPQTKKEAPQNNQAKKESPQKIQPKQSGKKSEIKTEKSFIIKKVSAEKFAELLKKIKAHKDMRYKFMAGEGKAYLITSHNEKAIIKLMGDTLELSGSQGDLFSELQLMTSGASDYKTAINSHIKQTGDVKRPSEVERQLKKLLPAAFEFLSEQSKIDLAIGVIDINNSAVVLSDYSTLLIPCFRGLERLIFDLQHAQGIVVKMIGQAYEKEDGNYVLKSGYRRKIPSVIYAEVMASLYTEYFKHRNFYAHSDGGYDNVSRIISDKKQVQAIFNQILEVINYNGKKLKEIGFRI